MSLELLTLEEQKYYFENQNEFKNLIENNYVCIVRNPDTEFRWADCMEGFNCKYLNVEDFIEIATYHNRKKHQNCYYILVKDLTHNYLRWVISFDCIYVKKLIENLTQWEE